MKDESAVPLGRRSLYEGRVVRLSLDRVRLPNGSEVELEIIRHPGAAAVVPIASDGSVLLVRQYRHATSGWLLEVPAGKLDPGEPPESCARREVEEETGHRAGRLVPMGWIFTTPGFTDERIWLYLAIDLEPSRQELQPDEVLTVERMPLGAAIERAERGEIRDGKSVCALLRARRHLEGTPGDSPCPPLEGVLETSLYVEDLERSAGFYRELFGFPTVERGERLHALGVSGRQVLLLFRKGASARLPSTPHDGAGQLHLAFAIHADEIGRWETWLESHGVSIEERRDWERGGRSIYFRDPDDHLLELVTPGVWSIY